MADASESRAPQGTASPRAKLRDCFVIMPFGTKRVAAGSDSLWRQILPSGAEPAGGEIDFDEFYKRVIKPAVTNVEGYHITCTRCDELKYSGWIHEKMISRIATADIAIVELTTLNPNVFYELGVRHALQKGITVLIQRKGAGERIPFNLGGMTVVQYEREDDARARDEIQQAVAASLARRDHVDSLVFSTLPGLQVRVQRPRPVKETRFHHYRVTGLGEGSPPRCIGIVTGDIAHVAGIDVWVSSENTQMEMARHCEQAISATVGYLGATKDDAKNVSDDVIGRELAELVGDSGSVPAGSVVVTGAGELTRTHGVRWIFHAAAVVGQVGKGYEPIPDQAACVVNALREVESEAFQERHRERFPDDEVRSIVMPLFGTGQARRDMEDAAADLFETVIAHFKRAREGTLSRVYFLAFDDETERVCTRVLENWPGELTKEAACPVPGKVAAGP